MEDAVAFSPNPQTSWVAHLNEERAGKRRHSKYADPREVGDEKNELKGEVDALLNSVSVAIGHMQNRKHSSTRIREFESVQADAQRVLSALDSSGSGFQLGELSRQESAIRSTFQLEEDRPLNKSAPDDDDDDDDDDDIPKSKAVRASSGSSDGDAGVTLMKRRGRMHRSLHHHVTLRNQSADIADDSKTDLLAAVAVAAAVYGGTQYEEVLAKRKDEMLADGTSETAAAERLALIEKEGKNISASMGKDLAQTHECLMCAAENIGNLHLSQHKEEGTKQLGEARASLVEYNDPQLISGFDRSTADWHQQTEATKAAFKTDIQSTRDGLPALARQEGFKTPVTTQEGLISLVSAAGLGEVFDNLSRHALGMEKPLEAQTAILDDSWKALTIAEADLRGMKAGEYKGDAGAVAQAAGTSREKIYEEVASYQKEHHVPKEKPEQLNARIQSINDKWKSLIHDQRHEASANVNIFL